MRYLTVTYYRKPDGRIDESVSVVRNLRSRDYTMASVILDFRKLTVLKASLEGRTIEPNFSRIAEYYHEHYPSTVEKLFEYNGYRIEFEEQSQNTAG